VVNLNRGNSILVISKWIPKNYCFLSLFLLVSKVLAQTSLPLHLQAITSRDGLSQGFVSSIVQDKKGLMWFATKDGLNRYDGYQFTVYHHDPADTTSVASDDLVCVFEDSKERLWVATRHHGLDLFDRENNIFIHFRHTKTNGLRSNSILGITEDKTGALWIRTQAGIDRLEILDKQYIQDNPNSSGFHLNYKLLFTHIDLGADDQGGINKRKPANVFVDSRNRVLLTTYNAIWEVGFNNRSRAYRLTKRFDFPVIDSSHTAILTEDAVNHSYYLNNRQIIKIPNYDFRSAKKIYGYVTTIATWTIDKRQRLWFPSGNKIIRIHTQSDKIENIDLAAPELARAINTSTVFYTDRTGVIWIATGGYGILKYDPEKERFHHILPGVPFYELHIALSGTIFTNTLHAITINSDHSIYMKRFIDPALIKKDVPGDEVISFAKDKLGNAWFGTHAGLIRYDSETKIIKDFPFPALGGAVTVPSPIFADKNNNIWMGYNKYLVYFDASLGMFTKYDFPVTPISYDNFLQYIYEDNNLLWLGSINGLFCFNTKTRLMEHYAYQHADTNSISSNFVLSMCNDWLQPEKYLWIGTKGGGLNRLDKQSGHFTRYSLKNGLANNVVYGILPDDDGNLWLSTNKGLSEFNPGTQRFRNFDVHDGLQSNAFNSFAFCRTKEGLLVFGGMNGINYFNPRDIKMLKPPEVIFTELRLFNKSVDIKKTGSPINKEISFTKEVILQYEQNVITLQFAAMDYRKAGKVHYRYKMQGFDSGWIHSGVIREATYTNLDPGTYYFLVQGSFAGEGWNKKPVSLIITVLPPWWRTWWFCFLVFTAILSVFYWLCRYRFYEPERLQLLRDRIARDLHDEVGSSINTIVIYSKIVQDHIGSSTINSETLLNAITENANEVMEALNDIVWSINPRNDTFDSIINRMRGHTFQLLQAKGYMVHFYFNENLTHVKLKMEQRRDFYLIFKEALNNIAKYSEGNNVWISLNGSNSRVHLTIKDDGKGFDIKTVRESSNGLVNMKYRADALNGKIDISTAPGEGTEIHLSFNKQ
jgi:ligand-binding sensor domain-containing protein/two-component sensor histidine kinase